MEEVERSQWEIRLSCTQSITPRGPHLESANGTGTEGTWERDFWYGAPGR